MLTGQLGDVMKESARIALSYVQGHADELGIDGRRVRGPRVPRPRPAGAIPKDGPSAGITMVTALASLLSGRPVKHTVGMTGEVTLQGRVLPIGGLKQKVLAAHAAGLTDVILPERNRADLDDVPEHVRDEMRFHPVMSIGEVLDVALEPSRRRSPRWRAVVAAAPFPRRSAARRTSSSGAGRSRSSTRRSTARRASTSSSRRAGRIPPRTLSDRLRELEEAGVLEKRVVPASPPYYEYRLTERGRRLAPVIEALGALGALASRRRPRLRRRRARLRRVATRP